MITRKMTIDDYENVYALWMSCTGMGLNNLDDSREGSGHDLVTHALTALKTEGINKVAMLVFAGNKTGNAFWEKESFTARTDVVYRNKELTKLGLLHTSPPINISLNRILVTAISCLRGMMVYYQY